MTDITPPLPPAPDGQMLIYNDGGRNLQVRLDGKTVWLSQKQMADLYQVTVPTVNEHLGNVYTERELTEEATIRRFRIVQVEGTRQVSREVDHYNLDAILAVGYRVRSPVGAAFRQWATSRLSELLVKGFTLDDERLKAGRSIGQDYFDELLTRIREIRASERRFYQKITDIYQQCSIDYDAKAEISQTFFATVQNKLHWAIHGHTAAELIKLRADAEKPHMGLTTWKNAPDGPVRKADVVVAKNYLTQVELEDLNRIVSMFLDYAEMQARNKKPMHMADWVVKLDAFLVFNEREVLKHAGKVRKEIAEKLALEEFAKFEVQRQIDEAMHPTSDFDHLVEKSREIGQLPECAPEPEPKKKKPAKRKGSGGSTPPQD